MRYGGEKARRRRMEGRRKRRKEQSRGRGEKESRESEGKIVLCVGIQKGEKKKKKERAPVQSIVWFGDLSWDLFFFIYFYFSFIEYSRLAIHLLF